VTTVQHLTPQMTGKDFFPLAPAPRAVSYPFCFAKAPARFFFLRAGLPSTAEKEATPLRSDRLFSFHSGPASNSIWACNWVFPLVGSSCATRQQGDNFVKKKASIPKTESIFFPSDGDLGKSRISFSYSFLRCLLPRSPRCLWFRSMSNGISSLFA